MSVFNAELLKNYKRPKTEKLCPYKCQGINFTIYTDGTVLCRTCGKFSNETDLLCDY